MAIYVSIRDGMTNADQADLQHAINALLQDSGIISQAGALGLQVTENGSPNMSVNVSAGEVVVKKTAWSAYSTNTKFYHVINTAAITAGLTIAANPGATRIDLICVKIDEAASPDADASNVATIVVVQGVSGAGVPATPSNHYKLAEVTVANGATSITNANITDRRATSKLANLLFDEPVLDNTKKLKAKDSSGTTQDLLSVDASNIVQVGDEDLAGINLNKWNGWISANETWTYASADSPIFTFTISGDKTSKYSVGMKIRISQSTGGTKYGIIHAIAYSAPNTTVTVYMGTDYTLNNEAISSPHYSPVKSPYGFPMNPDKWSVESTKGFSNLGGAATQNVYYNLGTWTIVVPIGVWNFLYEAVCAGSRASGDVTIQSTIATVNNGNTGEILGQTGQGAPFTRYQAPFAQSRVLSLAAKTTYYHNLRTLATGLTDIDISANAPRLSRMKVTSAYL